MKQLTRALLTFPLTLLYIIAISQPQPLLQYTRLTASDGLSSNSVQCILQDKSGIVWIGTSNGLNRYDGLNFIQFSVLSQPSLTNGVVISLLQVSTGEIWIGTENGLNILDPATNTIRQFMHDDTKKGSIPFGPVRGMQELDDGTVLIQSDRWIAKTNIKTLTFSTTQLHSSLRADNMVMVGLTTQVDGNYWISYLDRETVLVPKIKSKNAVDSVGIPIIKTADYSRIFIDTGNITWGISRYGINRYDPLQKKFIPWIKNDYTGNDPNLHVHTCYSVDADGNIWQGDDQLNLVKYDMHQKKTIDYQWLLTANNAALVNVLYEDKSNNIWVGTDNGIIKISSRASFFTNLSFSLQDNELKNIRCRRVITDKYNNLYAGTENYGLLKRTNQSTTVPLSTFGAPPINILPVKNNMLTVPLNGKYDIGYIYDMWYDNNNSIWIAGYSISKYDIPSSTLEIYLTEDDEQLRRESITLFSICFADSIFWTGGQFNIYTFNPVTRQLKPFYDNKGNMPFHNVACWSIVKKGKWIWAGTYQGLYKINSATHEVVKMDVHPVLQYGINDIFIDKDSSFWISTAGGGIIHYNETTGESKQYSSAQGLSNNTVCGILADNNNDLWISTYAGLSYFERKTSQFTNYFVKDGLNSDEFNRKAFAKLPDGKMVFGGLNGYMVFNPGEAIKKIKPHRLLLTRVSKTNRDGELKETIFGADNLKEVIVYPGEKFLSFGFTLTDMYDPSGNRYSYTLEGLDNEWHPASNDGIISFTSLLPGKYKLIVKGRINKGSEAQNQVEVDIIVKQVFYKTAWFIVLMTLLAAGIIYLLVRYRIYQITKWQLLRTRIASDLHDEVGGSLVRITLLADAIKREGQKEKTDEKLGTIAGISRGAINTMKDVIWSIDARNDTMAGLLDHMHEHSHNMLGSANIEFEFIQKGLQGNERTGMDFRQHVYLIFKEAINNIVKHSGATKVVISLVKEDGIFTMRISDNGKGLDKTKRGSGQGLSNMRMRAEKMNASLDIHSQNGTSITLTCKL